MGRIEISPSMMCADFTRLGEVLVELDRAGADSFHFDVMDGHFVPNFTLGPDLIRALRPLTAKPFVTHLMIEEPERFLETFARAGSTTLVVSYEACRHPHRVLQSIRQMGLRAGVALNPATPPQVLEYLLPLVDEVLVMTVNPGFAGQSFIAEMVPKVEVTAGWLRKQRPAAVVAVDGAIGVETAPRVVRAGASCLVGGTAGVFRRDGTPLGAALRELRQSAERGLA